MPWNLCDGRENRCDFYDTLRRIERKSRTTARNLHIFRAVEISAMTRPSEIPWQYPVTLLTMSWRPGYPGMHTREPGYAHPGTRVSCLCMTTKHNKAHTNTSESVSPCVPGYPGTRGRHTCNSGTDTMTVSLCFTISITNTNVAA